MFNKKTQYSYREQKNNRSKVFKFILVFLVLFIVYNLFAAFLFSVWVLDNDTMQPGLASGDRLVFSSFSLPSFGAKEGGESGLFHFKRGNIVLIDRAGNNERKIPFKVLDIIVRFFTAQRVSVFSDESYHIKRVIGLPGDEISMTNFVFRVRPQGSTYSLTEFELSQRPYHPLVPQNLLFLDESLPFSGNMEPLILGPDEIFVVSDDRSNTNDSRTWGVISPSSIISRAVLRIWPLRKLELL